MQAFAPLLIAVGGVPALLAAVRYAHVAGSAQARGLALRWAWIALAMFLGAAGLYWAGNHEGRTMVVAVAMVVAVNALLASMVLHLHRGNRER